jgi:hypothetical protein
VSAQLHLHRHVAAHAASPADPTPPHPVPIPGRSDRHHSCSVSRSSLGNACLLNDPHPPCSPCRFPNPQQPPATALPNVVWRRVGGALYLPTGKMPRLLQGAMQNHSFLGALAAVACKQDALLDLIVSDEQAVHGLYTLQYYKHGCWQVRGEATKVGLC